MRRAVLKSSLVHSTFEQSTPGSDLRDWLQDALHDLSQPLTALQGRLFLATLHPPGSEQERAEMRRAVQDGLQQCERMMVRVRSMQQHLDKSP